MTGDATDETARSRAVDGDPDGGDDDALSEEELEEVVGGLRRGWRSFDAGHDDEAIQSA